MNVTISLTCILSHTIKMSILVLINSQQLFFYPQHRMSNNSFQYNESRGADGTDGLVQEISDDKASMFTLVAIANDRFKRVCRVTQSQMNTCQARYISLIIGCVSVIYALQHQFTTHIILISSGVDVIIAKLSRIPGLINTTKLAWTIILTILMRERLADSGLL